MIKESGHFKQRIDLIGGTVEKGPYELSLEKLTRSYSKDSIPSLSLHRRRSLKISRSGPLPRKSR